MKINIVYACDDNFAEILGVSLLSLLESCGKSGGIRVYILDGGISPENQDKIMLLADGYDCDIRFIYAKDAPDPDMKQQRGSLATFARLYAARLLPPEVKKILYLDCDLLVLKDLRGLYDTDMGDCCCAGIRDCISPLRLAQNRLGTDAVYINAGVMLIDLESWRRDDISSEFMKFADSFGGDVPYADQGIINGVLCGRISVLPPQYNCYTAMYDFTYSELMTFRKPPVFYSEKELTEAAEDPAIVHFTTSFLSLRPWIEGCGHRYAEKWRFYKKRSPWSDVPLRHDNRSVLKKIAVKIFGILPRKAAVAIAGWLHSYVLPVLKGAKRS